MKAASKALVAAIVVGNWADTADSCGELGHEFGSSSDAEFFEASEFGDFEVSVFYVAFVVEEYGYVSVSFKPCDWVYYYFFHFLITLRFKMEAGKLYM